MKKLPVAIVALFLLTAFIGCKNTDDYWTKYEEWRVSNNAFFEAKTNEKDAQGNYVYEKVSPVWDETVYILRRFYNDTTLTRNGRTPLYTSTVRVKYVGTTYNGTQFDSSFGLKAEYGDSLAQGKVSDYIQGWIIALTDPKMREGDSCQIIVPQNLGYGSQLKSATLLPFSALVFDIKLDTISGLEKPIK